MPTPHEIVGSPYTIWVAPEGTPFPALTEDPTTADTAWQRLGGDAGDKRYSEEGVTVALNQEINPWTPAGSTMPVKAFRTAEASQLNVPELANLTVEQLALVLDRATTTTTTLTGDPDTEEVNLQRGPDVAVYAVLARGASPYNNENLAQFQVPRAYQDGNIEMQYTKGQPAVINATFSLLDPENNSADFKYIAQNPA